MSETSDRISLTGITAEGRHGVLPLEKRHGQVFSVDVSLVVDLEPAGQADDLEFTVDYDQVARAVVARLTGEPVELIETLAVRIAEDCLANPIVQAVHVTVHKAAAPVSVRVGDVAVTVFRDRSS